MFDWKSQAAGDRSCICTRQSRNRDCGAVHDSTDSIIDVRGFRARASHIPLAPPLREAVRIILPLLGTSGVVYHSRKPGVSDAGKGERDWISAFSVPPPAASARDSALIPVI